MSLNTGQLIVWLIVGALAGTLAAMLVTRKRRGLGLLENIVVGLVGAIVGGLLFNLLHINLGLGDLVFSAEDLVAAFVGSVLVLIALRILRR